MNGLQGKYYQTLAQYFDAKDLYLDEEKNKPNVRKLVELPWQQTKAEMWDYAIDTLCDLHFIQAKCVAEMTYDLIKELNLVAKNISEGREENKLEQKRRKRIDDYVCDLMAYEKRGIKEYEIILSIDPWPQEKIDGEIERIRTNPNRLDKVKAFINFLGNEADNFQNYAKESPNFVFQQAWNNVDGGPVGKKAEELPQTERDQLLLRIGSMRKAWNPMPQMIQTIRTIGYPFKVTPDGSFLLVARNDTFFLFDVASGQILRTVKTHGNLVFAISMTSDAKCVMAAYYSNKSVSMWNLETGKELYVLEGHTEQIKDVALTYDGKRALTASADGTIILWNLETGTPIRTMEVPNTSIEKICMTPDAGCALSGSSSPSLSLDLWDLKTGSLLRTLERSNSNVIALDITPDAKRAISVRNISSSVQVWDLETGKKLRELIGHKGVVYSLSITPDGRFAISGSEDNTLIFWNVETGEVSRILRGHTNSVTTVKIMPDGTRAFSGAGDGTLKVWDLEKGKEIQPLTFHKNIVKAVGITPDGTTAVSGSEDQTLIHWDLKTGRKIRTLNKHSDRVFAVSITPDGTCVLSGSGTGRQGIDKEDTLILWNIESGKVLQNLKGYKDFVTAFRVSQDGKSVLVNYKNSMKLIDIESGNQIITTNGHDGLVGGEIYAVDMTPDCKYGIAGSRNCAVVLWDLETGDIVRTLSGHSDMVFAICFTPDYRRVLSGSNDGTIILWDISKGKILWKVKGHTTRINSVCATFDGKHALSASSDNNLILWNLETGQIVTCYLADSEIHAVAIYPRGALVGETTGEISILNVNWQLLCRGAGIVNLRYIWNFESHQYSGPFADCPFCGFRFSPQPETLEDIKSLLQKNNIGRDQSPFMELPEEAWDEPGLLSECPNCCAPLKFNPFIPRLIKEIF